MIDYSIKVLQKYSVFTGRARRAEYWYFVLATFLLQMVLIVLAAVLGVVSMTGGNAVILLLIPLLGLVANVVYLAIIVPSIAVGVRRMHDVDKSGWFILIPFYNLYLAIQPGTVGPNRFGPDPKGEAVPLPTPVPVPVPPVLE